MRCSTTRTAGPGRRTCRATRSRRRRAPTARCCSTRRARSSPTHWVPATRSARQSSTRSTRAGASTRPTAAPPCTSTRRASRSPTRRSRCRTCCAATAVRGSIRCKRVLETIHKNVNIADSQNTLVCQDTGIAVYTCRVGEHFPLHPTRIYEGLRDGTARATVEHPLRSNAVHTITRENTGPNIGYRLPIVHWEFIADWDGLDVKCVPKGSGSENMSFLKMCVPADGVKGIKQFVLESIVGAGGKPCPPGIVVGGIGGSAHYAMYLAQEAIMLPVGTRNSDPIGPQ